MKVKYGICALAMCMSVMFAVSCFAGDYDLKEITPDVKVALEGRRARFDDIAGLKKDGVIGENNKGYVDVLASGASAEAIAGAENEDRKVIYTAIAEQNGLTGAFRVIEDVFAQVKREKANAGEMIQLPNGDWVKK